jgi:hypothetical protein
MSKYVEFMDMVRAHSCVHGMLLHVKICRVHGYSMSQFFCTVFHMSKCVEFMDTVRANSCVVHVFTCQNVLNSWIWLDPILLCT